VLSFCCALYLHLQPPRAADYDPTFTSTPSTPSTATATSTTTSALKRGAEAEAGDSPTKKVDQRTAGYKALKQRAGARVVCKEAGADGQWLQRSVHDVCADKDVVYVDVSARTPSIQ
jgi:hypothetical protein